MKKNIFIAAFAAVAMLASCGEKPVDGPDNGKAQPASITVNLEDPSQSTRVIDPEAVDADNVINDLIVFITREETDTFDVKPYFVDADDIEENIFTVPATTKAGKVYIVTNTGPIADGPFAGVANMDDVRNASAKIDGSEGGNKVEPGNVWMSGQSDEIENTGEVNEDGVPQLIATVQLYYIPAKVFVITKNSMTNYAGGKVVLEGVTITNAGAWTGFIMSNPDAEFGKEVRPDFSTENYEAPFYFNGVEIDDAGNYPYDGEYFDEPAEDPENNYVADENYYSDKNFSKIQNAGGATTHDLTGGPDDDLDDADAFYIFPALDGNKVWASIVGEYTEDEDAEPDQRFWNAAFGGSDVEKTKMIELKSGNKYIVTLEMAGDGNATDPGEEDPTVETITAELTITVLQAEWNVIPDAGKVFE